MAGKHLRQLPSGFFVLSDGLTATDPSECSLPFIYCGSGLKYLLAYAQGDLLMLMLGTSPSLAADAITNLQRAVAPLSTDLLPKLHQEAQAHGGEIGHLPGWRFVQESKVKARASPRVKISAMSHHARAVATALVDSLGRLRDFDNGSNVEVCAKSSQGVWAIGEMASSGDQRQIVVIREKKVDADASRAISSIETSLQSLNIV